ncbi:hypothetical protein BH20VER2_BH20VER2_16000 [soil metagenome]
MRYLSIACALLLACHHSMAQTPSPSPPRDINAVLAAHQDQLMAIRGVVGVYVGLADDDETECIKVMLIADDAETKRALPRQLEGYRVVAEVTGEIRPLPGASP